MSDCLLAAACRCVVCCSVELFVSCFVAAHPAVISRIDKSSIARRFVGVYGFIGFGISVDVFAQGRYFFGEAVYFQPQFLMKNLPACFFLSECDIFLQYGVVFLAKQIDRLLHMSQ